MLQNNPKLKSLIDDLWNKFWSGGISNPLTAIEQITYLLFMIRIDDLDTTNIKNAEFAGDEYKSKFEFWSRTVLEEKIKNIFLFKGDNMNSLKVAKAHYKSSSVTYMENILSQLLCPEGIT